MPSTDPYYADDTITLHHGDCLDVMREMPDCSVDAVVTDPPYGLEFMGREWDSFRGDVGRGVRVAEERATEMTPTGVGHSTPGGPYLAARVDSIRSAGAPFQVWCELWATECLRVLKPGGHLLAFGGSRTWHRLACAIEDAGFEMRDSIAWLYGSGFPKSHDVSKAIDWHLGVERIPLSLVKGAGNGSLVGLGLAPSMGTEYFASEPASEWDGWGTALKPAFEPIVVARKPLEGTVAGNVLKWGTGGLNVDGCRVGEQPMRSPASAGNGVVVSENGSMAAPNYERVDAGERSGRWPPNVVLDESQAAELDRQSGTLTSGLMKARTNRQARPGGRVYGADKRNIVAGDTYADTGGASRFFPTFRYEVKAPTSERPRIGGGTQSNVANPRCKICGRVRLGYESSRCVCPEPDLDYSATEQGTSHPTVKPVDLMRWLVRLVTPPGGLVLDPFAGSGTTGEACIVEGFHCVLIEKSDEYLPLVVQRVTKPIQIALDLGGAE